LRILIAEDQPDIAEVTAKLVSNAGHEPTIAPDGYAAVRMAAELSPMVVLLDINMPGIDGYETARRMRSRWGHRFPIFALTATPVQIQLAEQSGFDGIFSKPFDIRKLSALIARLA
jgi:CheY-like chemotaxis protein